MVDLGFNLHKTLQTDRVISVWDKTSLLDRRQTPQWHSEMTALIGTLGQLSAKAQGLPAPITTLPKVSSSDHRLYLYCNENQAVGLLKVGTKKLFHRNSSGMYSEIEPLCVLDFYVHESAQRSGIGRTLFEVMLASEKVSAHKMGYDRPSPKFIGFLKKHYNLSQYLPQANNFVVFNVFFDPQYKGSPTPFPLKDSGREDTSTATATTSPSEIPPPLSAQLRIVDQNREGVTMPASWPPPSTTQPRPQPQQYPQNVKRTQQSLAPISRPF